MEAGTTHIILFLGHEFISDGKGLGLDFKIDGVLYRRVSILNSIGFFKKGQLLWWKKNDEYLNEQDSADMEDMAETYFKTYQKDLPTIKQLNGFQA